VDIQYPDRDLLDIAAGDAHAIGPKSSLQSAFSIMSTSVVGDDIQRNSDAPVNYTGLSNKS
jgi:hypothetical protein